MDIETLADLYTHRLETIYSVELEQREILSQLEDDVATDALDTSGDDTLRTELRSLIEAHREQTETQIDRLETVFERLGRRPNTREAPAIRGLLDEKERFNNVILNDALRPAYYIEFMKLVERTEIIAYDSLLRIAEQLEVGDEATDLLEASLDEEEDTFDELDSYSPYEITGV